FVPEGTWARVRAWTWLGQEVWDDSPGADYENNTNSSLRLPPLNLTELKDSRLVFQASHNLEDSYDHARVEASQDGRSWRALADLTGWGPRRGRSVDLSAFDGKTVHVRFRLQSDGSKTKGGIRLGSLAVEGTHAATGRDQRLPVRENPDLRAHLDAVLTGPPGPARERGVVWLANAAERLHNLEDPLAVWQALQPELSRPDFERVGPDLLRCAEVLGGSSAASVWPTLSPLKERARALKALEELRREHLPAQVDRLWQALAASADSPDFEALKTSLADLARREGVDRAIRRFVSLGNVRVQHSVRMHELAQRLDPADSERVWRSLSGLDEAGAAALSSLEQSVRDWQPEGTWGRVRPSMWAFRQVWQDSPDGKYAPNSNSSLTAPPMSLVGLKEARLRFWCDYSLESGYDHVHVEASRDGGRNWDRLKSYSGFGVRRPREVDLADYLGQNVLVRFRLQSDGSHEKGGFSLGQLTLVGRAESGSRVRRDVDPQAGDTRRTLAELAARTPSTELVELARIAEPAGGTRNALALWPTLRTSLSQPDGQERRAAAARLAERLGVDAALQAWPGLSTCPQAMLEPTVSAADGRFARAPEAWSAVAPRAGQPDFLEQAAAMATLVEQQGEKRAVERWSILAAGAPAGSLADRVQADELAGRLEGRVQGQGREDVYRSLVASDLGSRGFELLRDLVGERREGLQGENLHVGDSTWACVRSPWWGFQKVWQDSPGADYLNGESTSLTSPPILLDGLSDPVLRFSEHHSLEREYDWLYVEGSRDGRKWDTLERFTGRNLISRRSVDLSAYAGQAIQVRFRLQSDGSITRSGVSLHAPRITARDAAGKPVELSLDSIPPEDATPYLSLAVDPACDPSQRRSFLELVSQLPPAPRKQLLDFCAEHPEVSLARAASAVLQYQLTSSDPDWLQKALQSLPGLVGAEPGIQENEHDVIVGGVVVKKRQGV
ncbi:MAG: hypothetical protein AB1758_14280, partial [Candidatus Eremiobacterota bacterium]